MSNDQYGSNQPPQGPQNPDYGNQPSYGQGSSQYPNSQESAGYAYPGSQSSAPYAGGESNSWGDPAGQRSAGYVGEGAYASQPSAQGQPSAQTQPSAQGQWAAQPATQGYGQQANPTSANSDDNFFKALFDFNFTRYATPTVIKIYYIIGLVLGALYWLVGGLFIMVAGTTVSSYGSSDSSGMVMGLLWLIIGAPVFFFYAIALRVQLEFMLALIRTNQDTKAIRANLGA